MHGQTLSDGIWRMMMIFKLLCLAAFPSSLSLSSRSWWVVVVEFSVCLAFLSSLAQQHMGGVFSGWVGWVCCLLPFFSPSPLTPPSLSFSRTRFCSLSSSHPLSLLSDSMMVMVMMMMTLAFAFHFAFAFGEMTGW